MDILIFIVRLLLTALLYAFLIAVFVVLWRDLQADKGQQAVIQERKARLVVLAGADSLQVDERFALQPFTTLGRNAANTIVVPDAFASAEHAIVSWRGGQWWLEDAGSRNGTRLNGEAVTAPTVLSAGDVISIGQVKFKFQISNDQLSIDN
jgi:pSer/pThr/pTyr-binding forkhead associated (FHA) protein